MLDPLPQHLDEKFIINIAEYLGRLYDELATEQMFSEIANISLDTAPASGHAKRLTVWMCATGDLNLVSIICCGWIVDKEGFRHAGFPLFTGEILQREDWEIEYPYVKFATDGRRVRFGMRFGPAWYAVREGDVNATGEVDSSSLIDR